LLVQFFAECFFLDFLFRIALSWANELAGSSSNHSTAATSQQQYHSSNITAATDIAFDGWDLQGLGGMWGECEYLGDRPFGGVAFIFGRCRCGDGDVVVSLWQLFCIGVSVVLLLSLHFSKSGVRSTYA